MSLVNGPRENGGRRDGRKASFVSNGARYTFSKDIKEDGLSVTESRWSKAVVKSFLVDCLFPNFSSPIPLCAESKNSRVVLLDHAFISSKTLSFSLTNYKQETLNIKSRLCFIASLELLYVF